MRVVLDANILVAAFIGRGVCNELFEHCFLHHKVVVSKPILDELKEVLDRKFTYSASESSAAARLVRNRARLVKPSALPAPVCRDSEDDVILGTTLAGCCNVIVTGDKDLLAPERWEVVRILGSSDFWGFESEVGG